MTAGSTVLPAFGAGLTVPSVFAALPFAALLLIIAVLPLFESTRHWWERNDRRLAVALGLGALTLLYYAWRGYGFPHDGQITESGWQAAGVVLVTAGKEYIHFMTLLFALYVISGGIRLIGDLPAHPLTNTIFLAVGAVLASFVGTTGASMILIRALLRTNREREHKVHTVCFFIIVVSNIGGCLTPLGDPPLFLGYLYGVPFSWPMTHLWEAWLAMTAALLLIYYVWDRILYAREPVAALRLDERVREPLALSGSLNFLWLALVILVTATVDPTKPFPGTQWQPPPFLRETLHMLLVGCSLLFGSRAVREANRFTYYPILEVAALFSGIFLTMQTPIEILRLQGATLGLTEPWHYFWATGLLSSFLDNAPTYLVFFETAGTLPPASDAIFGVATASGSISNALLVAISLGAVFMGANSYIGNGPNFMVKSIAEESGVRMPSFFGFILRYTVPVLLPLFCVFAWWFF